MKRKAKVSPQVRKDNVLLLSALAFLLVSTNALSLTKLMKRPNTIYILEKEKGPISYVAPLPVLGISTEREEPVLSAYSVFAMDVDSGVTLYERNADEILFPASTTKIVTALVALDTYLLDDTITVTSSSVVGQKLGIVKGEQFSVLDLLQGMLIYSANDAAEALSDAHPLGRQGFIEAMNQKARALHMVNTHFENPSGLENIAHVSSARDMAIAAKEAMDNPIFAHIVATKNTTIHTIDGKKSYRITNINKLIGVVDGVLGVKTGYTQNAKENLVTYVERNNKRVVISLLRSDDRFGETTALIDWIYKNYHWEDVVLP